MSMMKIKPKYLSVFISQTYHQFPSSKTQAAQDAQVAKKTKFSVSNKTYLKMIAIWVTQRFRMGQFFIRFSVLHSIQKLLDIAAINYYIYF